MVGSKFIATVFGVGFLVFVVWGFLSKKKRNLGFKKQVKCCSLGQCDVTLMSGQTQTSTCYISAYFGILQQHWNYIYDS